MKHFYLLFAVVCTCCLFIGCGAQPIPATPAADTESKDGNTLMTEWYQLTQADYEHIDFESAMTIANKLVLQGPSGLDPLFEVIESEDTTPIAKMLATASLTSHIKDSHVPRLIPLTDPKYNSTTRGCATHLLGNCLSATAFFKVHDLIEDSDTHVSNVATMIMLRKGEVSVLPKILEIWNNPATSKNEREEILMGMPAMAALKNISMFTESICNENLSTAARVRAIELLRDMASIEEAPALKACLKKEKDASLRDMLEEAIKVIEKREEDGVSPIPVQLPAGVDLVFQARPADPNEDTGEEDAQPDQKN